MRKCKNRITVMLTFCLCALCLMSCQTSSGSDNSALPKEVNIGTQQLPNDEMLAIVKGYFEEEIGVPVNILSFEAGDIRNAMMAGDIDFAMLGSSSAILGKANGMDVSLIWIHEVLGSAEQLVARTGTGITDVSSLRGKKVAAPFTSTAHYSLLKALELNGVAETELTLLDMQMPDIYAAWTRGDIDAAYGWEPTLTKLLSDGTPVITSAELASQGVITANVEIVRNEFAKAYPELVSAYIRALDRASADFKNDPSACAEEIASYIGISKEEALLQMQGSIWLSAFEQLLPAYMGTSGNVGGFADSVVDTADFLYTQKSLTSQPDPDQMRQFLDPSFIEAALQEAESSP